MRITITKGGIYGGDGKEIPVGTALTVKEEPTAWAGRYEIVAEEAEAKAKGGKKAVTNPAKDPVIAYEAKAKGDEWFIFDADGKEQGAALPEKDAEDFNGLSDDLKAAFVAEHVKA